MEVVELEKLWDKVLGRYHRAVQSLVAGILQESQYAVEKLVHAISHMRTPESAKTAALAVQQGCSHHCCYELYIIVSLFCSGFDGGMPHCTV